MKVLVTGAGGFLGGYLVARLLEQGHEVRAVSRRPLEQWSQWQEGAENVIADLRNLEACFRAARGIERIFHMAAMIGGIGYLENRHADCTASVAVTSNVLEAAVAAGCERLLFPSSACVYPELTRPIAEADVEPYAPRGGYGWSKLFSEKMCGFYSQQYGLQTRIARLGTVYGPLSPLGEAEKAPIAICRKVAETIRDGRDDIEIWGDGLQTRSFLYVDDCVTALLAIMDSNFGSPVNVDSERRVSINMLVSLIEDIAGVRLDRTYRQDAPQGVRGRACDVTVLRDVIGWQERTRLRQGLARTFEWVSESVMERAVA